MPTPRDESQKSRNNDQLPNTQWNLMDSPINSNGKTPLDVLCSNEDSNNMSKKHSYCPTIIPISEHSLQKQKGLRQTYTVSEDPLVSVNNHALHQDSKESAIPADNLDTKRKIADEAENTMTYGKAPPEPKRGIPEIPHNEEPINKNRAHRMSSWLISDTDLKCSVLFARSSKWNTLYGIWE